MEDRKKTFRDVANILGVTKANWARLGQSYKQAIEGGFNYDDFIQAAKNMKAGDPQYVSIYSVFMKTDYWLKQNQQPREVKGVW